MDVNMKLQQAILDVLKLDDSAVIFARKPWNSEADAVISALTESLAVPVAMKQAGFEYFLEKPTIEEFAKINEQRREPMSEAQFVELVIFYAENDAFPPWANDLSTDVKGGE